MTSVASIPNSPIAGRLQRFYWLHPDWWTVALCSVAWMAMLLHGWQHAAHGIHHLMTLSEELGHWLLMIAAMMLPLILSMVRYTATRSLWARRHRAMTGFIVGYFAPWLALGIVATGLRQATWTHTYIAPALGFTVAALWQLTPMHKRALIACHRILPLSPTGWRADRDCFRLGNVTGAACVSSCWPLMLACTFTGHSLIAMIGGMALGAAERWSYRPRTRTVLVGTLALAAYYGVMAGLDSALLTSCHSVTELGKLH